MPKYIFKDKHFKHDGKLYNPGDPIELSKEQAAKLEVEPLEKEKGQTDPNKDKDPNQKTK